MRDGDGNRVWQGGLPYADFLDDVGGLKTGAIHRQQMPESKRRVLRFFLENKGRTAQLCAKHFDLTSVDEIVSNFEKIGYVEFISKANRLPGRPVRVTSAGLAAYERTNMQHQTADVKYEVYKPPAYENARAGSTDALMVKSRG